MRAPSPPFVVIVLRRANHVPHPRSPSTYQVNVNRKKTRKWVEAKVQSYDGDDWGAPESEEEDDSPVAAPPPVPRPVGGPRLPSESRVASAGRPGHFAGGSTSKSGQPPVSVPTAQPPVEESVPAVTGPTNLGGPSDNVVSPSSGGPNLVQAEPVLPDSTLEQQPKQDSLVSPQNVDSAGEFEADPKRVSISPQLPNVSRMSGFGVDFLSAGADSSSNREPPVQEEREPSPVPAVKEPEAKATELVQSPTVEPEKTETHENKQPAQPVPQRPSLPGQYVTEDPTHEMTPTPMSPPAQVNEPEVSPISEHAPKDPMGSSAGVSEADSQRLQADAKSLPPLRTPSPHEPRTVAPAEDATAAAAATQSASSDHPKPEITPTEPLQPKPANYTPSDYEANSLSRQYTADTVTSSPVKESDKLSEEIMRTLTPGGLTTSTDNADDKRKSQAFPTGRESSYTLSGYDDYWADTADKRKSTAPGGLEDVPEVPPVPIVVPTESKAPEPTPVSPEPVTSPISDSQASLRRRFSWEAPDEAQAAAAAAAPAAAPAAPQPPAPVPEATKPDEAERTTTPGPTSPASPTIKIVPDTPSISHQVSQASSKPATQPTQEPPSPVSELSDKDATPLAQPVVSPEDGSGLPMASPLSSNPVSASHGEVQTPKISSPAPVSPGQPIMPFREIMEIQPPKDRIAKFEETRNVFASQDSGLDNWLTTMRSEFPEHATANGSYSGAPVSAPPSSAGGGPGAGQQAPQPDQPYYQQYLQANANAPGVSNTGSTRSRIAGYSSQAQAAAGSAFGDGGKQIGTKGKEFMHSAGKMGKGLFSKGKTKLQQAREARGDKVTH